MIKRTITYKALFSDKMLTNDFYFNLTMAEMIELEGSRKGGFFEAAQTIIESKNTEEALKVYKRLITASYGVRGEGEDEFDKSPKVVSQFTATNAYSVLYMELLTEAQTSGADFFNALVPHDLAEQVKKIEKANENATKNLQSVVPTPPGKTRLTLKEMQELSKEEIEARLRRGDMPPTPL